MARRVDLKCSWQVAPELTLINFACCFALHVHFNGPGPNNRLIFSLLISLELQKLFLSGGAAVGGEMISLVMLSQICFRKEMAQSELLPVSVSRWFRHWTWAQTIRMLLCIKYKTRFKRRQHTLSDWSASILLMLLYFTWVQRAKLVLTTNNSEMHLTEKHHGVSLGKELAQFSCSHCLEPRHKVIFAILEALIIKKKTNKKKTLRAHSKPCSSAITQNQKQRAH